MSDPSGKDLMERISRWSRPQHERTSSYLHHPEQVKQPDPYQGRITPKSDFSVLESPLQTEELRQSELEISKKQEAHPVVNIWDRRWCALVLHSVMVGIVSTVLPLCVYPFLMCNLNMEGTQTLSARTLLGLPWALKPMFTLVIQCSPLPSRIRLRSIMILGWTITSTALITIFFRDQPTPYFQDRKLVGTPLAELSEQQMNSINIDAPSHGAYYIMLMTVATAGYVLADVAADELIRDVATHHFGVSESPQVEDVVFQPVLTKYRVIAMLFCFLFMGFGMSGWDYGGNFDFSLEFTQVMLVVGLVVALLLMVLVGFSVNEIPRERRSLRKSLNEIRSLVDNCGLNSVLLCRFIGGICAGVSATAVNPVAFYYAGVQPLNDNVISFVAICVVMWALKWVDKKGWDVNYRTMIIAGTIITLGLDCASTMFTIWGVIRSQWLWIGLPVLEAIPSALDYTISTVILSEMADPSAHSTMSSLASSVSFLAGPLGLALSKYIDAQFDVTNEDIMADTTSVRMQIMVTFFIAYGMQLLSLLWLFALPKNRARSSDISVIRGSGLLVVMALGTVFGVVVHALSVYQPTSCLVVAGGQGC